MQEALRLKTTVLPGGRIEVADRSLPVGEPVDVVVTPSAASSRRSAVDILGEATGHRLFKTASEVESYLKDVRAAWSRGCDGGAGETDERREEPIPSRLG